MKKSKLILMAGLVILLQACSGPSHFKFEGPAGSTSTPTTNPSTSGTTQNPSGNTTPTTPSTPPTATPTPTPTPPAAVDQDPNTISTFVFSLNLLKEGVTIDPAHMEALRSAFIDKLKTLHVGVSLNDNKFVTCRLSDLPTTQVFDQNGGTASVVYDYEGITPKNHDLVISKLEGDEYNGIFHIVFNAMDATVLSNCKSNVNKAPEYARAMQPKNVNSLALMVLDPKDDVVEDAVTVGIQQMQIRGLTRHAVLAGDVTPKLFYDNPAVNTLISNHPSFAINHFQFFGLEQHSGVYPDKKAVLFHPNPFAKTKFHNNVNGGFFLPNDFGFTAVRGCEITDSLYEPTMNPAPIEQAYQAALSELRMEHDFEIPEIGKDTVQNTVFAPTFVVQERCTEGSPTAIKFLTNPAGSSMSQNFRVALGVVFSRSDTAVFVDFGKRSANPQDHQTKRQLYAFGLTLDPETNFPDLSQSTVLGVFGGAGGEGIGFFTSAKLEAPHIWLSGIYGSGMPEFNNIRIYVVKPWSDTSEFTIGAYFMEQSSSAVKELIHPEGGGIGYAGKFVFEPKSVQKLNSFTPAKLLGAAMQMEATNPANPGEAIQ